MILDRRTSEDETGHWDEEPRSESLTREISNVSSQERLARYGQSPMTVLLTGLPGAGKSSTAYGLERKLFDRGRSAVVIDGQNMRLGISRDLGFSAADRSENLRRAAEFGKLMNHNGLLCILALVAPSEEAREKAAQVVGEDHFLVVHLKASAEVCAARNQEARDGETNERAELDYQEPAQADLVLDTEKLDTVECVDAIIELLESKEIIQ
jgi:bifunctional enzyme CysN/CysC